jgi:FkbM family methyltransferase
VDVGAFHPYKGSNTYRLYLNNWRGVVVEPNPEKTTLFKLIRPFDICLTKAVIPDAWDIEEVEMLASGSNDARESITPQLNKNSHLDRATATHSYIAKTIRISEVLQYCSEKLGLPSLLSIDIEGLECELILGMDFEKYPVAILCIEHFLTEFTQGLSVLGYRLSPMVSYLEKGGYDLVSVCGVSLIFANRHFYVPYG